MAIAPRFAKSHILTTWSDSSSSLQPTHTIELYLDYVCPFSAKLFKTVYTQVVPKLTATKQENNYKWVFRNYVQPWHPSSTLVHEAALAVGQLAPDQFWKFSARLFQESPQYYDTAVYNETRNETYSRLAKLVQQETGISQEQFLDLVQIHPSKDSQPHNSGNKITNDLKLFVKVGRQNSIHVTPTVVVDGIVAPNVSSSFSLDEWIDYLNSL